MRMNSSVELPGNNKPEYGKKVVAEISKRLEQEYGSGFDKFSKITAAP